MKKLLKINWLIPIIFICSVTAAISFSYAFTGKEMSILEGCIVFAILTMCMFAGGMCMAADATEEGRTHTRSVHIKPDDCMLDKHGQKCVRIWHRKTVFLPFFSEKAVHRLVPAPEAYDAVRFAGETMEFQTQYVRKQKFVTVTDKYVKIWDPSDRWQALE